jgi:hypothetical protein
MQTVEAERDGVNRLSPGIGIETKDQPGLAESTVSLFTALLRHPIASCPITVGFVVPARDLN